MVAQYIAGATESSHHWSMDSGCSKYMTRRIEDFLSLKAHEGGNVFFGDGKKSFILGVERIGKNLNLVIEDVH